MKGKTTLRIGAGYYYGPGQTEDQVQPIDSDRATRTLTSNITFPVNPAAVLAGYNINDPNLGFQPRAYGEGYRLPEKVLLLPRANAQREIKKGQGIRLVVPLPSARRLHRFLKVAMSNAYTMLLVFDLL